MFGLALLSALLAGKELAEVSPAYAADQFYYYSDKHVREPLPQAPKVYVPIAQANAATLVKIASRDQDTIPVKIGAGIVFLCRDRKAAINLLYAFRSEGHPAQPVVVWQDTEVIMKGLLLVVPKPFVSRAMLEDRLTRIHRLTVKGLESSLGPDSAWVADVGAVNPLVVANMLAEDESYFKTARPVFTPLRDPVTVTVNVSSPGAPNLGEWRVMEMVVRVYSPHVTINPSIFPRLNRGIRSQPAKEDIWWDMGAETMTDTVEDGVRTIRISVPFLLLHYGSIFLTDVQVPYKYEDQDLVAGTPGVSSQFSVASYTQGTGATDLQPLVAVPGIGLGAPVTPEYRTVPEYLQVIGLAAVVIGCLLLVVNLIVLIFGGPGEADNIVSAKDQAAAGLLGLIPSLQFSTEATWRDLYRQVIVYFQAWHGTNQPVVWDNGSPLMGLVLLELDNLYKQFPDPNPQQLADDLKTLFGGP